MLELIKHGTTYDFMGKRKVVLTFSLIITLISFYGIFFKMDYGVDFRGGAEIQTKFEKTVHLDEVREALEKGGFKGTSVQTIGEETDNEVLIKVQADEGHLNVITQNISDALHTSFVGNSVEIRKVDIVGPKAGSELRLSAVKAMFWAILSIMVYMAIRFDFRYAPGVMVSLAHDIIIVAGVLSFAGVEFSLHIVAALLAIIGYSVNDTVIVYDRIREHEEKDKVKPLVQHINEAVNDTLSRTILTSAATLLVAASMFFFGGVAIRDFFLAMSIGIVFGTYSSVYVAASTTLFIDNVSKKWNTKNAANNNKKITA
jgi:preprotein translocase subunit SecF